LLYGPTAGPEFFDRTLFRSFIATLRELRLVQLDENAKLTFGSELVAWSNDSRLILSRELRHSILKITPETARASLPAETREDS
jgi:glycerol-3-phosphate O-acyltransferase